MVQALSIDSADATKLTALVQTSQNSDDVDDIDAAGAPAATVYKSHSGSIVGTLEDLKAKAESQLAEARQTEATACHNFQMLRQSSEDELKFNAQDLEAAKHSLGETQDQLTTDTADLKMTEDALAEDTTALEDTTQDRQARAVEFEAAAKSRSEKLEAFAKATAVVSEKTGGAETFSCGLTQTSGSAAVSVSAFIALENLPQVSITRVSAARISCCFRNFVCHGVCVRYPAIKHSTRWKRSQAGSMRSASGHHLSRDGLGLEEHLRNVIAGVPLEGYGDDSTVVGGTLQCRGQLDCIGSCLCIQGPGRGLWRLEVCRGRDLQRTPQ